MSANICSKWWKSLYKVKGVWEVSKFSKAWGTIQLVSLFVGFGCILVLRGPVPIWLGPLVIFGAWGIIIWFAWIVYGERVLTDGR